MLECVHVSRSIIDLMLDSICVSVRARQSLGLKMLLWLSDTWLSTLVHFLLVVDITDHSWVHLSWRVLLVRES